MRPMKVKEVIGYDPENRRSLNQIMEDHKPSVIDTVDTVEANETFERLDSQKFNMALTIEWD